MADTPSIPTLYDYNGLAIASGAANAPVTSRPGQALYNSQGGIVILGSDYGATPAAQTLKIDSSGTLATLPANATKAAVSPNSSTQALANIFAAMLSGAPTAVQMDAIGNVQAQPVQNPTFSVVAQGVSTSSGKSLLAILNKSSSSVLRLVACFAQNSGTPPASLTSYYIYAQELRFITGFTGGTAASATSFDSADTLPSGITFATGSTVSGEATTALRRWITSNYPLATGATAAEDTTADQQGREPWLQRYDMTAKNITIRPGAGLHLKAASTSTTGTLDVTFIFTQAAA